MLNESQFESLCDRLQEEELLTKPGLDETTIDQRGDAQTVSQPAASKGGVLTKPGSGATLKAVARRQASARRPRVQQPVAAFPSRTWLWLTPWALVALLCFGTAYFTGAGQTALDPSAKPVDSSPSSSSPKYITQKIRDLQVCTWVLADNPETEGIEGIDYSQLDLEVDGEHVYYVSKIGLLVHNNYRQDIIYRALSEADDEAIKAGRRLLPKGLINDPELHVKGGSTLWMSAAETIDGARKYNKSGFGIAEIDTKLLRETGSRIMDHHNLLQLLKDKHDIENAKSVLEVLIKNGIDPSAIKRIVEL